MAPPTLRIAVMLEAVQSSDIMGTDILGNVSAAYNRSTAAFGLPDFSHVAPEMEFFYPATTLETTWMTPNMKVQPTHTYDDCPRDLDILLIGGPLISHRPKEAKRFMQEAFPRTKVVMTTCIGAVWLASSGVLKGMTATTNRGFLPMAEKMYPDINWVNQRWVVDGKLWTSGGAGAGIDMIATYVMQHFDPMLAAVKALEPLDIDPTARGQYYKAPLNLPPSMLEQDWAKIFAEYI